MIWCDNKNENKKPAGNNPTGFNGAGEDEA